MLVNIEKKYGYLEHAFLYIFFFCCKNNLLRDIVWWREYKNVYPDIISLNFVNMQYTLITEIVFTVCFVRSYFKHSRLLCSTKCTMYKMHIIII